MPLRNWHRRSALLLLLFITLHMANHMAVFAGLEAHIAVMAGLRPLYRNMLVEPLLLLLAGWQAFSGLLLFWRSRTGSHGGVARMQRWSGLYIALFLMIHCAAVLSARWGQGVDTNIYFAIAGYHAGLAWFFGPYYALAVLALFTHLGAALHWLIHARQPGLARFVVVAMPLGGAVLALLLTLAFMGIAVPVEVPAPYLATFG